MLVPLRSEKRPKGPPMYRDPDNPFNTWTGIGKRPIWLQEKLKNGYELADMKVMDPSTIRRDTKKPKYRDPSNPENTWTGIGRRPKWLTVLLDNGMMLDDLKI